MDLLKAVNRILPVLGEHPVTSTTTPSRTLAILLPLIDFQIDELTMQGQWFNTFAITLYPDVDGNIAVPDGTLSFTADTLAAVVRGAKLYNAETLTYVWTTPVPGIIITRVAFEELPESMASLVLYSALVQAYVTDIGMESNVQMWMGQAREAEARVLSEHLRNMKYSTRKSPRWAKRLRAMRA